MSKRHALVPGTYCNTKRREDHDDDIYRKLGVPEEMAKKIPGSHWKLTVREVDGQYVSHFTCDEMPEMNDIITMRLGEEKTVDSPFFGGKCKFLVNETGDNCFKSTGCSEGFGEFSVEEEFGPCSYQATFTCAKTGAFSETWTRVVDEEGFFKLVKTDNFEAYSKATGVDMTGLDMNTMLQRIIKCGEDKFKVVEYFGDKEVVNTWKLDEESDYCVEGFPNFSRKMICSRTGPGRFKILTKRPDGNTEELNMTINDEGIVYQARDHSTGTTCDMVYERFCCISGDFQYVGATGFEEMGKVLGMPDDMSAKLAVEFDSVVSLREKPGGIVHYQHKSKYMPQDMMIKWDEEFEMEFPGMPHKWKCVDTKCGNKILSTAKTPKFTMASTFTVTDNFFVQHSRVVGTDVQMKVFRKRIGH